MAGSTERSTEHGAIRPSLCTSSLAFQHNAAQSIRNLLENCVGLRAEDAATGYRATSCRPHAQLAVKQQHSLGLGSATASTDDDLWNVEWNVDCPVSRVPSRLTHGHDCRLHRLRAAPRPEARARIRAAGRASFGFGSPSAWLLESPKHGGGRSPFPPAPCSQAGGRRAHQRSKSFRGRKRFHTLRHYAIFC